MVMGSADLPDRLDHYFSEMSSLQGGFHQQVRDSYGRMVEESYGTLLVQRSGKFRWQTVTPFVQQIVGDGTRIWIYDPDLDQVTVRRQKNSLTNTPASLLTRRGSLSEQFIIYPVGNKGGYEWADLIPKKQNGGYERLLVAMDDDGLKVIDVEDSLGQRTRIELQDLLFNPSIPEHNFMFTPPDGVDVVGDLP